MSIISSTIESALTGFSLANVKELAAKSAVSLLDATAKDAAAVEAVKAAVPSATDDQAQAAVAAVIAVARKLV